MDTVAAQPAAIHRQKSANLLGNSRPRGRLVLHRKRRQAINGLRHGHPQRALPAAPEGRAGLRGQHRCCGRWRMSATTGLSGRQARRIWHRPGTMSDSVVFGTPAISGWDSCTDCSGGARMTQYDFGMEKVTLAILSVTDAFMLNDPSAIAQECADARQVYEYIRQLSQTSVACRGTRFTSGADGPSGIPTDSLQGTPRRPIAVEG